MKSKHDGIWGWDIYDLNGWGSLSCRLGGASGGLFFDGRHSCAGDSFASHLGLYRSESLVVSVPA